MTQSNNSEIIQRYELLFGSLKQVIIVSEKRVLEDTPDPLFFENVNFFVKSYLVSICSYLEAYLQDVAFKHSQEISQRIIAARIPHNFVHWQLNTGIKDKFYKYSDINFPIEKKDIAENMSANPYRTIKLFQLLGVDLTKQLNFESNKDFVNAVVLKRNNIIHHNDSAADVSFNDLVIYIEVFIEYMRAIDQATV